jgi:hypothetical protein
MSDQVAVLLITGRHSIAGILDHRDLRVLDVLNDPTTEFLRLRQAVVSRHIQGEAIAQLNEAIIPKTTIEFVVLLDKGHEAPIRRHYGFVEKQAHGVFLLLADYEIRGAHSIKGRPDPLYSPLGHDMSSFFPITAATFSNVMSSHRPVQAGVIFVNKAKVCVIEMAGASAVLGHARGRSS